MAAFQSQKTHCKWGHPFDEANTLVRANGHRSCRACARIHMGGKYDSHPRPEPVMPEDREVLCYAAGILDGEGSVMIRNLRKKGEQEKRYHSIVVKVTSTDPRLTDWLLANFGGSVTTSKQSQPYCKVPHNWGVRSRHAEAFLRAVRPWLLIKGEAADCGLELQATMGRGRYARVTPELHAKREEIRARLQAINARGPRRDAPVPV